MMSTSNKLVLAGLVSFALLSGCGGGDESSGSATEFSIVPATVTVKGADATTCSGAGYATRVFIYGGAGPYRVDITFPDLIGVTPISYSGTEAFFDVYMLTDACVASGIVVVVDQTGRTTQLTVSSVKGS